MTTTKPRKYCKDPLDTPNNALLMLPFTDIVKPEHYSDYTGQLWRGAAINDPLSLPNLSRSANDPVAWSVAYYIPSFSNKIEIGQKVYEVQPAFKNLLEVIEESKNILDLKEGWDENNAVTISLETWVSAATFLIEYAQFIFDSFSQVVIDTPEINAVPNGTIDLSWRTSKARMLINIRKDEGEFLAYFYGDLYKNKYPTKGSVPTSAVMSHLAQWMKDNLKLEWKQL
jgi:hypothetical protein